MGEVDTNVKILGIVMIQQYNLRKGLELFGDKAELATVKELSQIHKWVRTYYWMQAGKLQNRKQKHCQL